MTFTEITDILVNRFGTDTFLVNTTNPQPYLTVQVEQLVELCQFLRDDDRLFFDLLACVTAIDNGPVVNASETATMEVVYNLTSIPYEHNLMLKISVPRNSDRAPLPAVPTVAHIWRTADWHEREAYDLLGINFIGHPDLRRILLPTDWNGYPLRRDYKEDEQYHGIKTK